MGCCHVGLPIDKLVTLEKLARFKALMDVYINEKDREVEAKIPTVGEDGYWYFGGKNTYVPFEHTMQLIEY